MPINDRFDEIKKLLEPLGFIPYYYDSLYNEHITKSINYDVYKVFIEWRDNKVYLYPSSINTQRIILTDEIDLKTIEKAAKDFIKSTKD